MDQVEGHLGPRPGRPSLDVQILTRSYQPAPNSLCVVAQGASAVPSARATALDSQFRRSYPDPSERDSFHTTASASPCGFVANDGICVAEPRLTSSSSLTHRPPNRGLPIGVSRHAPDITVRSEEHTSELQSLMRISYAVFCLKKKT